MRTTVCWRPPLDLEALGLSLYSLQVTSGTEQQTFSIPLGSLSYCWFEFNVQGCGIVAKMTQLRCQAKFLTCYCLSVILLLIVKE